MLWLLVFVSTGASKAKRKGFAGTEGETGTTQGKEPPKSRTQGLTYGIVYIIFYNFFQQSTGKAKEAAAISEILQNTEKATASKKRVL